jgi:hypothetical protein
MLRGSVIRFQIPIIVGAPATRSRRVGYAGTGTVVNGSRAACHVNDELSDSPQSDEALVPTSAFRWRHRWTVRLALVAVVVAVLTYVAAANFVVVELRLVGWVGHVRLSWIVLGSAGLGLATGFAIGRVNRWLR